MAKNIGYGSSLAVTTTTGSMTIGQIKTLGMPGSDATDVDTTTLDSSTNYKTFTPGLIDGGSLDLTVAYDPALLVHNRLATYHKTRYATTWTLTFNTTASDTQAFTGYVKSLGGEIPMEDLIMQDITLKVSGDPGWSTTT